MCRIVLLGLLYCVTLTTIASAEQPPAVGAGESQSDRRVRWTVETTVTAYDAVGLRDPRWDEHARAALRAAARSWGNDPRSGGDDDLLLIVNATRAEQLGCKDPLVLYASARSHAMRGMGPQAARLHREAADGFRRVKYHPIRRAAGLLRAAQYDAAEAGPSDEVRATVDEALALLPEAFADHALPPDALAGLLDVAGEASIAIDGDRKPISARVIDAMGAAKLPEGHVLTARGAANIKYAWDARGGRVCRHGDRRRLAGDAQPTRARSPAVGAGLGTGPEKRGGGARDALRRARRQPRP